MYQITPKMITGTKTWSIIGIRYEALELIFLVPSTTQAPSTFPKSKVNCHVPTIAPLKYFGGTSERYNGTTLEIIPIPTPRSVRPTMNTALFVEQLCVADPMQTNTHDNTSPSRLARRFPIEAATMLPASSPTWIIEENSDR